MALLRGRLFSGALFAGALFGGIVAEVVPLARNQVFVTTLRQELAVNQVEARIDVLLRVADVFAASPEAQIFAAPQRRVAAPSPLAEPVASKVSPAPPQRASVILTTAEIAVLERLITHCVTTAVDVEYVFPSHSDVFAYTTDDAYSTSIS